jgi:hypothetical protein
MESVMAFRGGSLAEYWEEIVQAIPWNLALTNMHWGDHAQAFDIFFLCRLVDGGLSSRVPRLDRERVG